MESTRLSSAPRGLKPKRRDGGRSLTQIERLALFVCGLKKEGALGLLEHLAEPERASARRFARAVTDWDSATRQGRLTAELGLAPDADERIEALIVEAPARLRVAIVRCLPPAMAAGYPHLLARSEEVSPAMAALARRLVRDTIRA